MAVETAEQREARLQRDRDQRRSRRATETGIRVLGASAIETCREGGWLRRQRQWRTGSVCASKVHRAVVLHV